MALFTLVYCLEFYDPTKRDLCLVNGGGWKWCDDGCGCGHQQNMAVMCDFDSNGREVTPDYTTIPNQTQNALYLKNLQATPNIRTRNGTVGIPYYLKYTCRVRGVCLPRRRPRSVSNLEPVRFPTKLIFCEGTRIGECIPFLTWIS